MAWQPGVEIGAYKIIEQLGSGGMATVYKAHQPKLDRFVAIKAMHQGFAQEKGFLERFEREARIVARLDHYNIVPIYDYDEHQGQPYLVMKFIEGRTLKDVLRQLTLSPDEILQILTPIADALAYAHEQGVLHRDIKPSNIIIDNQGTTYLTDFGLARMAQSGESTMSADVMIGTPHYISPEQAQGKTDLDARTDVYSLGVVLYETVTGRVPFTGDSSYAIVHDHIYTPPPPPRSINPDVTPGVERVLLNALAKNRQQRYATPTVLIDDFRRAARGESIPSQQASVPSERHTAPAAPPSPPHPPRPAEDDPWEELERELRVAGDEMKRAFKQVSEAWKSSRGRRHIRWAGRRWPRIVERAGSDEEDLIRQRVKKRLKERSAFLGHLRSYIMTNLFFWFIWLVTGAGYPWPIWITIPWGIGMVGHTVKYYSEYGPGRDRSEEIFQRELERERQRTYGEKRKRDFDEASIRLTEDGELSESFVEEWEQGGKRKNQ